MPRLRVAVEEGGSRRLTMPAAATASGRSLGDVSQLEPGSTRYALNECFIGESDPSRPLDLEVSVDGGPWSHWRSSGLLVATQLGASAWLRNATAVDEEQVAAILHAAASNGLVAKAAHDIPRSQLSAVAQAASATIVRHEDPEYVQYLVRDPVPRPAEGSHVRSTVMTGNVGADLYERSVPPHSLGRRVRVRPNGWHAQANIDGLPPLVLPPGCVISLEVESDHGLWFRTLQPWEQR